MAVPVEIHKLPDTVTLVNKGAALTVKGFIWGGVFSFSQAMYDGVSTAFTEARSVTPAKAINVDRVTSAFRANFPRYFGIIGGHTALFLLLRDNIQRDRIGLTSLWAPLFATLTVPFFYHKLVVKAMPSRPFQLVPVSIIGLHLYDRVWKPHSVQYDHVGAYQLWRRVW